MCQGPPPVLPSSQPHPTGSIRHKLLHGPTKRVHPSQEIHAEPVETESVRVVHPAAVLPVRQNQNRNGWRRSSAAVLASATGVSMLIQRAVVTHAWTVA